MPRGIAWGAPRRLSAWGYARPEAAQPTEGWAKLGAMFAPLWGACVYRLFIFEGRPKASSRRCKKEKAANPHEC